MYLKNWTREKKNLEIFNPDISVVCITSSVSPISPKKKHMPVLYFCECDTEALGGL
jgi:hypothetical protein